MEHSSKRILNLVCLAFLFTVPLYYDALRSGTLAPRDQQWACYAVFAVVMLAALIKNIWVSLFLLLNVIHFFFIPNEYSEPQLYIVAVCSLIYYGFSTLEVKHYKWALVAFTFLNALIAFTRVIKPEILIYFKEIPNGMLATAAMITPLIASISPLFWVLGAIMVLLGKSLIPILAFLGGAGFCLWHTKRKLFWITIPIIIPLMLFVSKFTRNDPNHMSESLRRTHVWQMVISKTLLSPWTGIGMGSFKQQRILEFYKDGDFKSREFIQFKLCPENKPAVDEAIRKHTGHGWITAIWDNPHDEFIYVFFEYGIVGLVLIGGFIFTIFRRFNVQSLHSNETIALMASFIALLIFSTGHFPFYLARMNCLAIAFTAMLDKKLGD